MKNIDVTSS